MKKNYNFLILATFMAVIISSCSEKKSDQPDIVNDLFPESQKELREVMESIVKVCETADLEGLKTIHLASDKFTKFGPRSFERQDVNSTNASEIAHFGSISNFKEEVKDLKIDVFGDVGIVTYYPNVTFEKDGIEESGSGRKTLVFLKTNEGWKIIHEHGEMRQQE